MDNRDFGVFIHPLPDDNLWLPEDNVVRGNTFEGNTFGSSLPLLIEDLYHCGSPAAGDLPLIGDPVAAARLAEAFAAASAGIDGRPDYTTMPDAPDEPGMPDPWARDGGVEGGGTTGIPDGYRRGR